MPCQICHGGGASITTTAPWRDGFRDGTLGPTSGSEALGLFRPNLGCRAVCCKPSTIKTMVSCPGDAGLSMQLGSASCWLTDLVRLPRNSARTSWGSHGPTRKNVSGRFSSRPLMDERVRKTWKQPAPPTSSGPPRDHLTFGLRSSCERAEPMLPLLMRVAPVSILAATCSPFEATSAVFTPS
jgi:hypothetical protein